MRNRIKTEWLTGYNTMYDCSEVEGRVMEKPTLNITSSVLAEDTVEDLKGTIDDQILHQQSRTIEEKQNENEDEASFSDSS